jgi:O-antigen/teichoic acid export membrane protein
MKFRNKIRDISSIGVSDITASGISALFWFFIASTVGPEDYGEITYFISIAMLSSNISLLGAVNTNIVYTAKKIQIQSTLYVITLSTGLISSFIVLLFFNNLGTSFLILALIVFGLSTSEILGRKLYLTYSKFVITQRILMITFGIGLYHIIGIQGILIGYSMSYLPYIYVIVKTLKTIKIDFLLFRTKSNFIIPQYFQSLSGSLSGSLDKLIIGPIFGFGLLGNYSLGLQFFSLLTILPVIVAKYIIPQDSSGVDNKKLKKIIIVVSVGLVVVGFFFGPIISGVLFPKFLEAEEVIKIISFAVLPWTINAVYYSKFYAAEKSRNVLISSLIMTSTQVVGIITLGNYFGVNGIAVSYVLGTSCSSIYLVLTDRHHNNQRKKNS